MSQPTPSDVHVNTPLTNISVAYLQDASHFVASKVFPNVPVGKQSDLYYAYDRGYFNRDEAEVRAPGTESKGGVYTVDGTPSYYAHVYAFHHDIPDQRRANADSVLVPDREATELVTHKALIRRETVFATNYLATSVWDTDVQGGVTVTQWNDASSTPVEDVRGYKTTVLESTGFEPNTLVIGQAVFDALIDHPDIVDRVKYGQTSGGPAMVDTAELSAIFKIPNVYIMKAIQNTAKQAQTNVHAFIGGKKALLCYAAPAPSLMTPSAGYTFSWNGYVGAAADGQRISKFRMEHLKSDRVEIEMAFDLKAVSSSLGVYFYTIVA